MTASLDRLGVCNRLNLLLICTQAWDELLGVMLGPVRDLGITASLPPHDHPLGHEWALDSGHEATLTIAPADSPAAAARLANELHVRAGGSASSPPIPPRPGSSSAPTGGPARSGTPAPGCSTGSSCVVSRRPASTWTMCPARVARSPSRICACGSTWSSPPEQAPEPGEGERPQRACPCLLSRVLAPRPAADFTAVASRPGGSYPDRAIGHSQPATVSPATVSRSELDGALGTRPDPAPEPDLLVRHDGDAGELVQPVGGAARSAPSARGQRVHRELRPPHRPPRGQPPGRPR